MKKLFFSAKLLLIMSQVFAQQSWKLSIQTWTFHKHSLLSSIVKTDSLGVNYIEVYPWQPFGGKDHAVPFGPDIFNKQVDKTLKFYLKGHHVKVIAMGVLEKAHYKTKEGIEEWFAFAKKMKISFITAEPEWEDLDEFNRLAKKYKVKVALHCHPKPYSHYWHPDSMMKAMQGREYIGAWPDIGHWTRNGVDIIESLKKMEGKLWGLHFKDVREFDNLKASDTLFGMGVTNLPAVLQELKRQRFKGVISMEYESHENNNMADMRLNKDWLDGELKKQE